MDRARRRTEITENAASVNGHVVVGTPKTHERRTVVFPAFLDEAVEVACKGKKRDALLWGDGVNYLRPGKAVSGWFTGAVKRAQVSDPDFPRVTPHDLRHTAASLAISAGANVKALQRMLAMPPRRRRSTGMQTSLRTTSTRSLWPSTPPGPNSSSSKAAVTEYLQARVFTCELVW